VPAIVATLYSHWRYHSCYRLHLRDDLLAEPLPVQDGKIRLPSAPGLGPVLDEAVLERRGQVL
jgi:L-alanine-DL-glutamate epimerase-like enolase superfamily enzyme